MMMLGMGIAITVPYLVLFATNDLGMTSTQYGLLLALAAISQFTMNTIVARFSDTHSINRKTIIITALLWGQSAFQFIFTFMKSGFYSNVCHFPRLFCPSHASDVCVSKRINQYFYIKGQSEIC